MNDPTLQIKDLDTGETVTVSDYLNSHDEDNMPAVLPSDQISSSSQVKVVKLPSDLKFKTFINNKNQESYSNVRVCQYLEPHKNRITCLVTSRPKKSTNHYVASGDDDGLIILYQFTGFITVLRKFSGHTDQITCLTFGSNDTLLSSSMDKSVRLWHPSEAEPLATFLHDDIVTCVAFHPSNPSIFIAGQFNNTALVWDIAKNEVLKTIHFETFPTAVSFSNDGQIIAIGLVLGQCHIYSYPELNYVTKFIAGPRAKKKMMTNKKITSIAFINHNEFLIASNDSRIRLYSLANFSVIRKFAGHVCKERHNQLSISPDGKSLMIVSEAHGSVYIWPVDHEKFFKGGPLNSFVRDRSETCEGFKFGSERLITASVFTYQNTPNHLSAIVADCEGNIFLVLSK
ncbi:beta-transducin [Tritrichomonas foetus]|uniref:Beta-transducin n=1 Tax=Tritrichomonas foetus TaxID=1144522 RepID=A0A1J4J7P5_9EUKA|nr:beta-transducin [Tritrichomonas foetus]|eukprot:OHS94247.1 beta-transducin [Tritrichomonas foetus]